MKNRFFDKILFILVLAFIFIASFCLALREKRIAIIGAMDIEINEILENLDNKNSKQISDFKITTGNLGKYKVILSKSGIGKVNSASTTQFIIDKYKPKYIINIGMAGGISPNLKAGDVVIGEKTVQHDFDITAFGKPKGYIDNSIEPNKPTLFHSDKTLINKFSDYKDIKHGTIATGDIFVINPKLKNSIQKEFNADLIDMESAAIVQTARRNNIPVIVLRTVSDEINDTTKEYKTNKQNIAKQSALAVISILKSDKF